MLDNKTTSPSATTTCTHCHLLDPKILHHVRLGGTFRRLCTTCVLRLHPKSFCPSCFTVYHHSPPDHPVVCHKCHSSSHRTCVPPLGTPCATCLNPNGLVFDPKPPDWSNNSNSERRMDLCAARLLLAAAEISWMSMSKAEVLAVTEADWRAKEAAEWRKKAKEAINKVVEIEKKRRGDDCKVVIGNGNGNGNGGGNREVGIDYGIGSVEVSDALNAVKLGGEPMGRVMKI